MTRPLDKAYDKWRGVPATPERPVGTLLSDRELALTKQAFEGGVLAALEVIEAERPYLGYMREPSDIIREDLLDADDEEGGD